MNENERPKLRVVRGNKDATDSGDHGNPYGIPRPSGRPLLKKTGHPSMGKDFNPGANRGLEVPFDKPSVDSDPTPPHGILRSPQFKVIKGGKE